MSKFVQYLSQSDLGLTVDRSTTLEPVTLNETLIHCRIDPDSGDEDFIGDVIIPAARQLAEQKSGSVIRPARYIQYLNRFPGRGDEFLRNYVSTGHSYSARHNLAIPLANGLVFEIESITYIDRNGVSQTGDITTVELVQTDMANSCIQLLPTNYWPDTSNMEGSVTITYKAGMRPSDFKDQYPSVRHWILLACAWAYSQREMFYLGRNGFEAMPPNYIDALLDPIRVNPRF